VTRSDGSRRSEEKGSVATARKEASVCYWSQGGKEKRKAGRAKKGTR